MEFWISLNGDQQFTSFVALFSALLGGAISMITTWLLSQQANKHALKMRSQDIREKQAFFAQKAFVKIYQFANSVYSLKKTIDEQFDEANAGGDGDLLPAQKVQEILSLEENFEVFETQEIAFLLHTAEADLLGDLLVFEKRVLSVNCATATYNKKRTELTDLLETGAVSTNGLTGTRMSVEMKGKNALLADVRVAVLNKLLGDIMMRLERDLLFGRGLLDRFQVASRKEFGELFPNLKFEVPD